MTAGNDWAAFEQDLRQAAADYGVCAERTLVYGDGNRAARIVLVGEAPGAREDEAGRPFVGSAGQVLDEALSEAGLQRGSVWITNVVKCRPTRERNGRLSNRPPSTDEFALFLPWLEREIGLLDARVIVCLGATAARAVLRRKSVRLGETRGTWLPGLGGVDTMATYHPAYLLRRLPGWEDRRAEFVEDLRQARAHIG